MKNKNTVIALLIIFVLICGYNLYWTYVQFSMDSKRDQLEKDRQAVLDKAPKERTLEDTLIVEEYDQFVNDAGDAESNNQQRYQKAIENSFTLGLDLQGGMFVTLEVGIQELLKQLAGSSRNDSSFVEGIKRATARAQSGEQAAYADLFIQEIKQVDPNVNLGAMFSNRARGIGSSTPEEEVRQMLITESEDAIDRTYEIIRARIDQFGVVSPNLQKQETTGRILLELPGVKEPERVRKLLRSTAKLEFWETHTVSDAFPVLNEMNERLKILQGLVDTTQTDTADSPGEADGEDGGLALDADAEDGGLAIEDDLATDDTTAADTGLVDDDIASLEDSTGLDDGLSDEERIRKFKRENPLFAVLQPPNNNITATSPVVGYSVSTDTAEVNKYLRMEELQAIIPDNMRFAWTFKPLEGTENIFVLIALKPNAQDSASLDGSVVTNARQNVDERGRNVVSMSMNSEGANEWALITRNNVNKSVAITLDGMVYSYPVVNEEIRGGNSQISGDFEVKEAKDLATVLKAGQLPIPATIESEETVGPTLGRANIRSGYNSFIAAFIVTLIFMAFYYAKAGIVADLALMANLVFIFGCAAAFTIVLTLPGFAAMVLTVGMAVDANVLIFERIREEMAKDKTLKASIKSGFSNAFSSVMDANITTFLTGVVLYAFGVGPIRGFAVTLMIGIITSLISALIITRLILDYYANRGRDSISFGFPFTTGLFDRAKLNMVGKRKMFYMISGAVILISLASFALNGLKTGVDFQGGRQFVMQFADQTTQADRDLNDNEIEVIRGDLNTAFGSDGGLVIKTLRDANRLQITTSYKAKDREATDEVIQLIRNGLNSNFSGMYNPEPESAIDVGPTVAGDIKRAAGYAVIFSLIIIFFYILLRFRKWQYSLGAIVAIFHDVIIVLGIFSLLRHVDLGFSVEINQALIAALLTIIGYSINDTVVVFDRIRENLGEMKASKLSEIYNVSIDQTISRTLITSITTLLTAIILFIFGGDVIRGFVFAIIIGIIVGTYSSIFVASPISLDLILRGEGKQEAAKVKA